MSFNFDLGSNSPSTPNRKNKNSLFSAAPSTTPAGNPPTHLTNVSTTPAGPPPQSSRIFGSSYNAATNTFGRKGFAVPESSPPRDNGYNDEADADGEDMDDEDDIWAQQKSSFIGGSPRGLKRSRDGAIRNQDESGMVDIAKALARDTGPAKKLEESDDVVLATENVLVSLDVTIQEQHDSMRSRDETITNATAALDKLWGQHCDTKTMLGGIGPESDDAMTKSTYLSTLLLQLHGPYTTKPSAKSQSGRRTLARAAQDNTSASTPLPRALLDWLNTHHNPLPDDFQEIHLYQPSPAAHQSFWDVLGAELLRGRVPRVIRLLKDAGWQHADTAKEDNGSRATGYSGRQLQSIEDITARCSRVLESCPAVTDDDWNVVGSDWDLFRQRARHTLRDLESVAATTSNYTADVPAETNVFARASMTAQTRRAESSVPESILHSFRTVYGILLGGREILDYAQDWLEASIFLTLWWDGEDTTQVLDVSLAGVDVGHLGRKSLRKSTRGAGAGTREVDVAPLAAYRRRLEEMFTLVTSEIDEPNFQPDTMDQVHVALGCVMEDSVEGAIETLRTWSPTVSTAVVELAALGGWLPQARPTSRGRLAKELSSEDLMVLSHGAGPVLSTEPNEGLDRDSILNGYAKLLSEKDAFRSSNENVGREGWELAIGVLGRLDDIEAAQDRIREILERIEISDEPRVEKVLDVCQGMGFGELGRGIAERYADILADQTPSPYGSALIYYARAHATRKLRDTLSFLISLCLLQSAAMPPPPIIDSQLASLLSTERAALVKLARVDVEGAALLGMSLSGYATLRRFYELRDQEVSVATSITTVMGSLGRKREAAKSLVAVIESASDCIKGGLFDPEVESVVPVECLLVLLGEALPLLVQHKRTLDMRHVLGLMGVLEDFEAVSERIKKSAEGLLQAAMNVYSNGTKLQKSKSTLNTASDSEQTSASSWEDLAESAYLMLQSAHSTESEGSAGNGQKGKAVDIQRGWDWRKGLDAVAGTGADVGSKEVVMMLRTALAREVARGWGAGR